MNGKDVTNRKDATNVKDVTNRKDGKDYGKEQDIAQLCETLMENDGKTV